MATPAPKIPPQAAGFTEAEVEKTLRDFWHEQQNSSAAYGDPFSDAGEGTVFDIEPRVSSQEAVTVLIKLKKVLGYEPPASVIKRGGYKTCEEFVQDLAANVRQWVLKKKSLLHAKGE
jgi:hypothetical protein